jgi:methionine-gamma-lyase
MKKKTFESLCVHETPVNITTTPTQMPMIASSSFRFESIEQGIGIFKGEQKGDVYGRYGNPTIRAMEEKLAALEGFDLSEGAEAVLFSSGMSAISTLLLCLLKPGEKVLTQGNLYGGTTDLLTKVMSPLEVEPVFTDLRELEKVEDLLKKDKSIRLLYFETPANPTLACVDIDKLASLTRQYGLYSAVDNTFCTPYLQRPLSLGVDFVVHSTTKYLNGHGNSIAGVVIGKDKAFIREKLWTHMKLLGTNSNPFDAWLLNIGLKTLILRMEKHCQNALEIASFLEHHPKVDRVNYVGLESHPDFDLARRQMTKPGGMISFELKGGLDAGIDFMNRVRFCTLAPTLGDIDTLLLHPASMSHINVPKELRLRNGITDGLIRLSVGVEDANDIIADLDQALR